jgi:uncharacterized protein YndB with AHSA1/START domain
MNQPTDNSHDLVLTRVFNATPDKVFAAWTQPDLLVQWFAPLPWTTSRAELDVRAGGSSLVVMKSPEGEEYPNPGVYLEVIENRRLVATDAYSSAWQPSAKPFMTLILDFELLEDNKTRYTATVRHWSAQDKETHIQMGFYEGWGQCADQLAKLVEAK